ncbi:unnamed protein product [Adineta steineri]|uniref:Uncharacterized protein n=1 Tax=Adineta steineri TaxID=433720 RepID=A0A815IRE3_9BILA|nr:unnamed protein product [Adineta steineri]CAF1371822.1 unnamed protein product [Adineta steineri]CAF1372836.1 unnamed protein product [Adineta steineri]
MRVLQTDRVPEAWVHIKNVFEINCARGAGAAWCVHTHASHSYTGIDSSQDIINLCQRLYSKIPRLSFVVANATNHFPFENDELIIEEKVNITRNILHALDIQNKYRTDFIQRYIQPEEQEYFRLFAGLPGTQIYDDMSQGCSEYWRVVFRKKKTTNMPII